MFWFCIDFSHYSVHAVKSVVCDIALNEVSVVLVVPSDNLISTCLSHHTVVDYSILCHVDSHISRALDVCQGVSSRSDLLNDLLDDGKVLYISVIVSSFNIVGLFVERI